MITFSTRHYSDISMFESHATELLRMMGHSGKSPGAILADDVRAALDRLRQQLKAQAGRVEESGDDSAIDKEDDEPVVDLNQRAWPLIQLLEAANQHGNDVMWK